MKVAALILSSVFIATIIVTGRSCSSVPISSSNGCIRTNDARGVPAVSLQTGRGAMSLPRGSQVIVASYNFSCCGQVTHWRTHIDQGRHRDRKFSITFQVWRPSTEGVVSQSGCYSLVGENTFDEIPPDGEVCLSPPVDQQVRVQPGDVVGFYQSADNERSQEVQVHTDYNEEEVWYQTNPRPAEPGSQCSLHVGRDGTLSTFTEHAPIISVSVEATSCPLVMSTETSEMTTTGEASQSSTAVHFATDVGAATSVKASKAQTLSSTLPADTPTQYSLELGTSSPDTATTLNRTISQNFTESLLKSTANETTGSKATATTRSEEGTLAKNYHTAFVTSIATGTVAASILLLFLLATCICLHTALVKHRRRRKETADRAHAETLENSLMYNDIYIELSKEKPRDYGDTFARMEKGEPLFSEEPVAFLQGNPPTSNTRKDSRYVLRHNAEPTSVPPLPPKPMELSSSSDYMVPGTILSNNLVDHTHWHPISGGGNSNNLVAPYAVAASSSSFVRFPVEPNKTVETASNVAYNVLPAV